MFSVQNLNLKKINSPLQNNKSWEVFDEQMMKERLKENTKRQRFEKKVQTMRNKIIR